MFLTLRSAGQEKTIDVQDGQTIAEAARLHDIQLYGSCGGHGICAGCSRYIASGIVQLLNRKTGLPYQQRDDVAPYAKTCIAQPVADGVVVETERSARLW
jgi:ferredoxin